MPHDHILAFPSRCDFALTRDEATWLTERIVDAVPGTLLAFLVGGGYRPADDARYAWKDPAALAATGHVRHALDETRRFAVVMHGAQLLYNVLLAERAGEFGLAGYEEHRDRFPDRLGDWRLEIEAGDVREWDLDRLWALVAEQGRPAALQTRLFVTDWVALTRRRLGHGIANDLEARSLIETRERHQKRGQARLLNDRLMRQWGGASGSERLNFRWPVIARLMDDIADGRERGHARP